LLVGDFNENVTFVDDPAGHNTSGRLLVEMAASCDLQFVLQHSSTSHPSFYTRRGGSLATGFPDHALASAHMTAVINARVHTDMLGVSDHRPVSVELKEEKKRSTI
jgi:endonuclease/exonuclease/phosphatase family metal-dependent hydrolase